MSIQQVLKMDPQMLMKAVQMVLSGNLEEKSNDITIQTDSINVSSGRISDAGNASSNKRKADDLPSHALIYWINEGKYSTIQYKAIELGEDSFACINKEYNIKFNTQSYKGRVIMTGLKTECEKHYDNLRLEMSEADELDSNIAKSSSKNSTNKDSNEIYALKNKQTQLKDEIEVLKLKLIDSQNIIKESKKANIDLTKQLNEEKAKNQTLINSFCNYIFFLYNIQNTNLFYIAKDDKEKFILFSKNFLKAFEPDWLGTNRSTDTVLLHHTCPSVFVPSGVYAEVSSLLKHSGTTTSSVIRIIMNTLIPSDVWSKNGMNYTNIKKRFPNEHASCFGEFNNIKNSKIKL